MPLDVSAHRRIPLPQPDVAAYAMDWRNDAEWTQGIKTAELTREARRGGFGVGAEVTRTAYFLGRRIETVLRVAERTDQVLDMLSTAGPFPMHVTYTFRPDGDGATEASIRVRGGPTGPGKVLAPLTGAMVRRNLKRDLRDLERKLR